MATIADGGHVHAGFFRKLRLGAVFVEARHGEEPVARHVGRVVHGDEAIRVARIADDKHPDVARGVLLNRPALTDENFAVDAEQILAFHAGLARHAADEQRPVHAAKTFVEIRGRHDALEQRKRAVVEFHRHAAEGGQGGFDFEQMQDDGLVRPEHRAGGDAKQKGIADLAGGAGDGDANGCLIHF